MRKALIIGSGFSGLSTACFLAKAGYKVEVLEKNEGPGGRCRVWESEGFRFDMGPSWYWMPDVFERFFQQFGKKPGDYFTLKRLDPSYRVFFDQETWDIPAGTEALGQLLEKYERGAAEKLNLFLKEAKYKYETGMKNLVYKPGLHLSEFIDLDVVKGLFRLDLLKSMSQHIRKYFHHPKIIQLLEFPVLFLGAKPSETPALYSLMNYADIELGTWYPEGGMFRIVEGMYALAQDLGVAFRFGTEVQKVHSEGKQIKKVQTNQGMMDADIVISGADYHHMESKILEPSKRNYSEKYWESRTMAPSSLLFYLGLNKKVDGLLHHNLFFDADFDQHASDIYDTAKWPEDPLFYVSCTSKSDSTVAPEGMENLFVLIPLAPGLEDSEEMREKFYRVVMKRLESQLKQSLRDHVILKRSYAMKDFVNDYHSFKGNAYGLANTLRQTAILKPSLKNKKLDNLYYTGQLTVPGPGVPPSLISGEVVSKEIIHHHPIYSYE
ncbi:MAG: phytoene desaturase [Bacteroidetes bacterium]|nr:phytoene desaturase [Bacteroidota bacterium]